METIKIRRMAKDGGGIYETEILGEFTLFGERFALHEVEMKSGDRGYYGVTHFETSAAVLKEVVPDKKQAFKLGWQSVFDSGESLVKAKIQQARTYWNRAGL